MLYLYAVQYVIPTLWTNRRHRVTSPRTSWNML